MIRDDIEDKALGIKQQKAKRSCGSCLRWTE